MADIVSPEVRSRMMAGIRGKNTSPELLVRKLLFAGGFRFRLHDKKIPGKPDLVFRRLNAVIFIHGCFWHGHDCHLFKMPSTRKKFWQKKIGSNQKRDLTVRDQLKKQGWRVLEVWECALRGKARIEAVTLFQRLAGWLASRNRYRQIGGSR